MTTMYNKDIQPLEMNENLLEMQNYVPQLKNFNVEFKQLKYLGDISPRILWNKYSQLIDRVNLNMIFQLSKEEILLFSRLKFASIKLKCDNYN